MQLLIESGWVNLSWDRSFYSAPYPLVNKLDYDRKFINIGNVIMDYYRSGFDLTAKIVSLCGRVRNTVL